MKFISWLIIVVGFLFAGLINTASFQGKFWKETSEQAFHLAQQNYEYSIDYEISNIENIFDIESYNNGDVIKVVNGEKIFYYQAYQAQFINTSKWQDPIFWSQTVVNTIYVTALYAVVLINKQTDLLNAKGKEKTNDKGEVIDYEPNSIEKQYEKLFNKEKDILEKKADFERYLTLVVNEEEITEIYIEKLKKRKKRIYQFRYFLKLFTFNMFKWKNSIKSIELKIDGLKRYKLSLFDLQNRVRQYVDIPIKHKEITYDAVFDRVDISTSHSVRIGYSRQHETRKRIMKSPITSFISIFSAVVFLGNMAVTWGDWWSMVTLMITLVFASGMKIRSALNHANDIIVTLLKSLEKTNMMIATFIALTPEQLVLLKKMGEEQLALPQPKPQPQEVKIEQEETIEQEVSTDFNYGYDI
jgi:hypothetical protein